MVGSSRALRGVEDAALVELKLGGIEGDREGANLNESSGNVVRRIRRGVCPVRDGVGELDVGRLPLAEFGVTLAEGGLRL